MNSLDALDAIEAIKLIIHVYDQSHGTSDAHSYLMQIAEVVE